ncbi:acyl--CoA ligase [Alkalihalobacillus sp. MEB130]|uniref:class I adenylate-forming enzyme family protein n=1 Tax=Alkalihalobacillus sp. MEB130 TaxID=2976704 RepID=UPI0028DF4CD4|nr:class I adenylate-forming enzyme family protein [Alkalihalobacillus sp. MEB130]MDT8861334.1 acyl--CoA ligase [Alkalihalobacillus sp. MEB130]
MNERLSLSNLLDQITKSHQSKEVVYDGTKRICYQQLRDDVQKLASALTQKGVEKGDRVLACLPNWYEFVVIYFGLATIGAVFVPCNPRSNNEELEYILESCGANTVFLTDEFGHIDLFKHYLKRENDQLTLRNIFTVRSETEGYLSFNELLELGSAKHLPEVDIDPIEDVFTILYTSGTTGKQKGVMLTHQNVIHIAKLTTEALRCKKEDVLLVAVPAFHVFGFVPGILSAIIANAKIVLMEKFQASEALKLIEREKVTIHHGVPTMFVLELNDPNLEKYDLSSLRTGIIAAAPCPEELVRQIRTAMGCDIVVSYGLTETSAGVTMTNFDDEDLLRSKTVGKALQGIEIKIVNHKREEVSFGEIGEIAVKSVGVMKGYFQLPKKTNEVIDHEGWFYTGDFGTINEKGYVRILGRKNEMMIHEGERVFTKEIEHYFCQHPSILEAVVIGFKDEVLGDVICAAIKLRPGHKEDEQLMKSFIQNKVASYKIPDYIVFLDELPMTGSGKIKQKDLEESLIGKLRRLVKFQ